MKVDKRENKIPVSISSKRKMTRITISVDGASPIIMEFMPSRTLPWMIGNFRFESNLEFHVFGVRGGRISDSDLEVDWLTLT